VCVQLEQRTWNRRFPDAQSPGSAFLVFAMLQRYAREGRDPEVEALRRAAGSSGSPSVLIGANDLTTAPRRKSEKFIFSSEKTDTNFRWIRVLPLQPLAYVKSKSARRDSQH
jgi:hypothetical protein